MQIVRASDIDFLEEVCTRHDFWKRFDNNKRRLNLKSENILHTQVRAYPPETMTRIRIPFFFHYDRRVGPKI